MSTTDAFSDVLGERMSGKADRGVSARRKATLTSYEAPYAALDALGVEIPHREFNTDAIREYPTTVPLRRFYSDIGATEVVTGSDPTVAGHTVINSIAAISRLSSEEFYRLYGQSTNRALVFSDVTSGEGPLVAQRVVTPTPTAVVLHGVSEAELWEHAPELARTDGYSLAVTDRPLGDVLETLRGLP